MSMFACEVSLGDRENYDGQSLRYGAVKDTAWQIYDGIKTTRDGIRATQGGIRTRATWGGTRATWDGIRTTQAGIRATAEIHHSSAASGRI